MNVLLIYPPTATQHLGREYHTYGLSPPLGLLTLAQCLIDVGHTPTIIDYTAERYHPRHLIRCLEGKDAVALSLLTYSMPHACDLIKTIKNHRQDLPVIIGGPHPTMYPRQSLIDTGADYSISGEGEQSILMLLNRLQDESLSEIPGLSFRTSREQIISGKPPVVNNNLDTTPIPARELVKGYTYGHNYDPSIAPGAFTSMTTTRGCPYRCSFCSRQSLARGYRSMSNKRILDELHHIQRQGYTHLAFTDDCFLADTRRSIDLFETIIAENIDLTYYITNARVDSTDDYLYGLMRRAGVIFIQYGLESANQDTLDVYRKNITPEQIKGAVTLSHNMGFFTAGSFILGAPNEKIQHIDNTISFARRLPLEVVSFSPLKYVAGSELWQCAVDQGNIGPHEYIVQADRNRGLGNFTTDELISLCRRAQRSYYLRPRFPLFLIKSALQKHNSSFLASYLHFARQQVLG